MASLTDKLPATTTRVELNTAPEINERIRQQTESNVAQYAGASREAITNRLHELEQEWDMERVLEANAATVFLITVALGLLVNRKWFMFSVLAAAFLLQHAIQG